VGEGSGERAIFLYAQIHPDRAEYHQNSQQ
jgi:hypothetical protein